jgi:hypothetical protein
MGMAGDHPRAVGGDDPAQIGHRQTWAMLGQQARHLKTAAAIAPVAGHRQHRETGSNLTEQDDTSGHRADPRWTNAVVLGVGRVVRNRGNLAWVCGIAESARYVH